MRKTLIGMILAAVMLLALTAGQGETAAPETMNDGDFTYILLEDGTAEITGYTGEDTALTLPEELGGQPVTAVGNYAFSLCGTLKSVMIPEGVTRIGNWAFFRCTGLESIEIPEGVTEIGYYAFYECSALTMALLPADSLTVIGTRAFACCEALEVIDLPESLEAIGADAFAECGKLTAGCAEGSFAEQYCRDSKVPYEIFQDDEFDDEDPE